MVDLFDTLFRVRVRYVKRGRLRYLSHLEILRSCERLVLRAGLPFAITQGFSPRMRIAFGPALPVGVASDDEWFDLMLLRYVPAGEVLRRLREASVEDLMPQEAAYVNLREDSLSAALTIASWRAQVYLADAHGAAVAGEGPSPELVRRACDELLASGEVRYLRSGKERVVPLAGKVARDPEVTRDDDGRVVVTYATRSSNEGALRPDVFMGEVCARCQSMLTAGRERGAATGGDGLSSEGVNVRSRIRRVAQYLESEDGTWLRPIRP
ncbi:DUF2344 domain-containing protein [bacterium]|nr:DUF2344 domain-containing protein [bacterium]